MFGRFNQEMKSPSSPGSSAAFRWREVGVMNTDWTSAGNESRKEKKKASPITLVWFNYLWELLFSWGFIRMLVMNSICEEMEGTGVALTWCCRDTGTHHWEGVGVGKSSFLRGPEGLRQREGTKDTQWTWPESSNKHRGVRDAGCWYAGWHAGMQETEGTSQRNSKKETMSLPFSAAHFNLLNAKPGQNNVRFVSNFMTNKNLILACRRDEQRDRF